MLKRCEKCGVEQEVAESPDDIRGNRFCIECGSPLVDFIGAPAQLPPDSEEVGGNTGYPLPPVDQGREEPTVRAVTDTLAKDEGEELELQARGTAGLDVHDVPTRVYEPEERASLEEQGAVSSRRAGDGLASLDNDPMDEQTVPETAAALGKVIEKSAGVGVREYEVPLPKKVLGPVPNEHDEPTVDMEARIPVESSDQEGAGKESDAGLARPSKPTPSGLSLLSPVPKPPPGMDSASLTETVRPTGDGGERNMANGSRPAVDEEEEHSGFTLSEDDLRAAGLNGTEPAKSDGGRDTGDTGERMDSSLGTQSPGIPSLWQPDHEKTTVILDRKDGADEAVQHAAETRMDGESAETADGRVSDSSKTLDERATMVPGRVFVDSTGEAKYAPYVAMDGSQPSVSIDVNATAERPGPRGPVLGTGRHSRILLVRDEGLSRNLALKEPLDPSVDEKLMLQTRALSAVSHPSIVQVIGAGETSTGRPYLLMPLLAGKTMADRLASARDLSSRMAVLLPFLSLCKAVGHAHQRGVCHRSLHPSKIVLIDDIHPVLLGWGRCSIDNEQDLFEDEIRAESAAAMNGLKIPDPSYMSPEQASGDVTSMGPRSDVWALGAILFHILTGRPPYHDADPGEAFLELLREPVPDPVTLCREAPVELAEIASKALSRRVSDRYPTASELALDVESFVRGDWVRAYQHSRRGRKEQLRWFVSVFKKHLMLGAAVLLAVLALATARHVQVVFQRNRAQEAELQAKAERDEARKAEAAMKQEKESALSSERRARQALAEGLWERAKQLERQGDRFLARLYASASLAHFELPEARYGVKALSTGLRPRLLWHEHSGARCGPVTFGKGGKVACGSGETLLVWDTYGGKELVRIGMGAGVSAVAFSPDGRLVACGTSGGAIELRDAELGLVVNAFSGHDGGIEALAFSPNGRFLASGGRDRTVRVWDTREGRLYQDLKGHQGTVQSLAFSPDSMLLASGGRDRSVRIWDITQKTPARELDDHSGKVVFLAFVSNNRLLFATDRGGLKEWSRDLGKGSRSLLKPCRKIGSVAVSKAGAGVAVVCSDGKLQLLEMGDFRKLEYSLGGVRKVAYSPNKMALAVSGVPFGLKVLDLSTSPKEVATMSGNTAPVLAAGFSSDGTKLYSVFENGVVKAADVSSGTIEEVLLQDAEDGVKAARFASKRDILALQLPGGRGIRVYKLPSGEELYSMEGRFTAMALNPAGRLLAVAKRNGRVKIINIPRDKEEASWRLFGGRVHKLAFSNRSRLVVAGTSKGDVVLFNLRSKRSKPKVRRFEGYRGTALAFMPGDRYVLVGMDGGRIVFWDLGRDVVIGPMRPLEAKVTAAGFSRDGRTMAVGDADGRSVVFKTKRPGNARGLHMVGSLAPHQDAVSCISFSSDGRLATSGMDGGIRTWTFVRAEHLPELPPADASGLELLAADEKDFGMKLVGFKLMPAPRLVETRLEKVADSTGP